MSDIVYRTKLLTGSTYFGLSDALGMQDFGIYVFPGGTRYNGNFCNGRFHGHGVLQMAEPHRVTFRVIHDHGQLTQIRQIAFDDELEVDFNITKQDEDLEKMSFANWSYCTSRDRRFQHEIQNTIEPVGPLQFKGKEGPILPKLAANIFDLGFGRLNKNGFLLDIPNYLTETRQCYVGCPAVRQWIRENCRHGSLPGKHIKQKFRAKWSRQIIQNNLEAEEEAQRNMEAPDARCKKIIVQPKTKTLSRICRRRKSESSSLSAKRMRLALGSTSDSCTSLLEIKQKLQFKPKLSKHRLVPNLIHQESSVCRIN
ncbi:MORN repeat-containing protein 5 [Scaptodrosophila lebanonensis]|uniref:MORN repeat-containing protein 5 n=1 Tax=Drosophila lebanonensis TaxID=7225 RepID=A0A6J2UBW8_DROLE|nr:MORN repeat-containing protein 5 [Scaptodrosophila lebanonensis]